MNKDDMVLISVDDHIVEPPDLFKNHLSTKYLDDAPRLVHNPDGSDTWQFRDTVIPNVALNAVAGRPKEEHGLEPQGLDEIRKGCFDAAERVKDMNAGGVLATMNFPSFPGFAGRLFATDDSDFSLALVQAYNDWHIDEWCGSHPGRFIPMALPVIWNAELRGAEVRRASKKGVHSLTFTENPAALGYPSFHDDYWKPMWEALVDTDTVMNVHIGYSGKLSIPAKPYHFEPFRHVPREQATVGALRAAAGDHDVTTRALSKHDKAGTSFADFQTSAKEISGQRN